LGRPLGGFPRLLEPWQADWRFAREFFGMPLDREAWERWTAIWAAAAEDALDNTWFDGIAVPVVQALVDDSVPPSIRGMEIADASRPGVSLLSDGSLLAPLSLMKPDRRIEL
jgi:hypothetical protein